MPNIIYFTDLFNYYHPPKKLREVNVFSGDCPCLYAISFTKGRISLYRTLVLLSCTGLQPQC